MAGSPIWPVRFSWLLTFIQLCLFRYVRLWVNLWAIWRYKPAMPLDHPSFTSQDLTVVIPTIAWDINQLRETVKSAYALEPAAMIVVTPETQIKKVDRMVEKLNQPKAIRVMTTRQANKRRQLSRAIPEVRTGITLFMDDDVWLPRHFIKWILAPFEDPRTGGAGTNQAIRRKNWQNLWEWLGAVYLIRRNFDCTACNWIDGGLPCLSGRAVAYRTRILQDPSFTYGFTHETWGSEHFLNVDDDNFVTRWLFSHNWKIKLQNHRECLVETTLETSNKFLKQCLRWVRSNWRSNMTTLGESHMWRKYPWSIYAVFLTTFTQWVLLYDILLFACFWMALAEMDIDHTGCEAVAWTFFVLHFLFTKTVKLLPHLVRNPADVKWVPVSVLFGYFHNLIKLYGFVTIRETTWGTREGADEDESIRMMPISSAASNHNTALPNEPDVLRERGAVLPTATVEQSPRL